MSNAPKKSLMRSLGEFFGHIAHGVKSNPRTSDARDKKTIRTTVEEKQEGNVILRRTTIEEVEVRKNDNA
jgi:hypothetical protein